MRVNGAEKQPAVSYGNAAVYLTATRIYLCRESTAVSPVRTPGDCVQSNHIGWRLAHIHYAVHHQGGGLNPLSDRHLIYPRDPQFIYIVTGDLLQRTVTPASVCAGVGHPLSRLLISLQQPVVGHLRNCDLSANAEH